MSLSKPHRCPSELLKPAKVVVLPKRKVPLDEAEEGRQTLSELFDKTFHAVKNFEMEPGTTLDDKNKRIERLIRDVEVLTEMVSDMGLFSSNESVDEFDATKLKFLLLPNMLGQLWEAKPGTDRTEICQFAKVYFEDFIERLVNHEIIPSPPEMFLQSRKWSGDPEKNREAKASAPKISAEKKREQKIRKYKACRLLDQQVEAIKYRRDKGEPMDEETLKDLYLLIIKREGMSAEAHLESIVGELELISEFRESTEKGDVEMPPPKKAPSTFPANTFILTRTEQEKKVFGLGYPATPVMTVEELYEQRIKDGTWSKDCKPSSAPKVSEDEAKEQEELCEEMDDLNLLNSRRAMDEYRDDHRRGWGNRMNRS